MIIGEGLATERGLGSLLKQSRSYLDCAMIWTVAAASALLSVAFTLPVGLVGRHPLLRLGMRSAD